jgi:hypothetical protein
MLVAQTDAWKTTVQSAQQSWTSSVQQTNDQVRSQLVESIQNTMQQLTQGLDGSLSRADDCMTRRWEQWQVLLSNNARLMSQHQQELVSQTQALQQLTQHSQTICEGSTNKAELNQSLAATTQAIVATRDLEAAIAGLSEQFKGVGVAPAEPLNATAEPIATKRGRKDVAVERRSDRTAAAPRRSAAPSISSFAEVAIPATTTNQQKPAAAIEEVILPIAPYLSGEKKLARSAGDQTSNRARPTAARKAA